MKKYKVIDLFCGAGGLSLGFSEMFGHPFEHVWANDFNQYAADTYNNNFGNVCVCGDIIELLADPNVVIPNADVVIGGPPCQGFSLLNRNRNGDVRRSLWRPYMEVVKRSQASIFVMENVPQLLQSDEFKDIQDYAEQLGFKIARAKLCAADYGVPQIRYRAFIIGCRFSEPSQFFPPEKTHFNPELQGSGKVNAKNHYSSKATPWRTVRDAIGDLPDPVGTEIREEKVQERELCCGLLPPRH